MIELIIIYWKLKRNWKIPVQNFIFVLELHLSWPKKHKITDFKPEWPFSFHVVSDFYPAEPNIRLAAQVGQKSHNWIRLIMIC